MHNTISKVTLTGTITKFAKILIIISNSYTHIKLLTVLEIIMFPRVVVRITAATHDIATSKSILTKCQSLTELLLKPILFNTATSPVSSSINIFSYNHQKYYKKKDTLIVSYFR